MDLRLFVLLAAVSFSGAAAKPTCCWSKWGDETTCGKYDGHGAQCNTDHTKTCNSANDCPATPAPAPIPPSPSPPPVPPPSPPAPTPAPTPPSPPSPPSPPAPPGTYRGKEWYGYWEDWCNENEDTTWWADNTPGHCKGGCVLQKAFFQKAKSYNTLSYAFSTLLKLPKPAQNDCKGASCPVWDGKAIYREKDASITASSTVENPSPTTISISEFCRLSRQFPGGPKRCLVGLGGWSDWARLGSVDNAQKLAKLVGKLVLHTFADGIDFDFEHLAEYSEKYSPVEVDAYIALVNGVRAELDAITTSTWSEAAKKRITSFNASKQQDFKKWHQTQIGYLQQVISNGPPKFELVYTTRFNAFRNPKAPFDWEKSNTNKTYITDDEGRKVWPQTSNSFDTVNIMSYDQDAGLELNFQNILKNFHSGGVPMEKINIGFEPGEQGGGGIWEGQAADLAAVDFVNSGKWGGAMIWGVNPDSADQPKAKKIEPAFVAAVAKQLKYPAWPWGKAPVYSEEAVATEALLV